MWASCALAVILTMVVMDMYKVCTATQWKQICIYTSFALSLAVLGVAPIAGEVILAIRTTCTCIVYVYVAVDCQLFQLLRWDKTTILSLDFAVSGKLSYFSKPSSQGV